MIDKTASIEAFLAGAAAKQPTPGGGSVAALAGALAAAMGEMVLQYSVGKKGLEGYQGEIKGALAELGRARRMLLELMAEDQGAFEVLTEAKKAGDTAGMAFAMQACISVPEAVGAAGAVILELCDGLVEKVNVHLLSDLAVCGELAMATVRCAIYNVRVNLADIKDDEARRTVAAQCDRLAARGLDVIRRMIPRIQARQG